MKKRIVDLRGESTVPLLDIVSFGRRGPGRPLTQAEAAHAARTVRRVPEVMIKVSGGARSMRGVAQHLGYIGREGEGIVEGDDGELHQERGFEHALLKDWDLDMDEHRRHTQRAIAAGGKPPKLVHNLLGVEANATERAVRGQVRQSKKDGIYRGDATRGVDPPS